MPLKQVTDIPVERSTSKRDTSQSTRFRFNVSSKSFTQQYDLFYESRLRAMSTRLVKPIQNNLDADLHIRKICDIVQNERCVLIGTLFKHMDLQPSILRELSDEIEVPVQPLVTDNFTSEDDILYLEDSLQRITLKGDIKVDELVTGVVVAVSGLEHEANPGVFMVDGICFPEMDQAPDTPSTPCEVLLVSGLEFGGSTQHQMSLELLTDYITGGLPDLADESKLISRLFVVGNSISHEVADKEQHYKAKYLTKHTVAGTVDAVKDLNSYLQYITRTIPVTLMPGESDPSNHIFPQQPLHPCMFTDESGNLETATNPYMCELDGYHLLGNSGQPVSNIKQFSKLDNSVDILKKCLTWCHMAPTSPDTLAAYPYTDEDPFIIEKLPHLFFAGNQTSLDADIFTQGDNRCLCLSLPKFSETGVCVKVNLQTLEWEALSFKPPSSNTAQTPQPDVGNLGGVAETTEVYAVEQQADNDNPYRQVLPNGDLAAFTDDSDEEDEQIILDPSHPLMLRFQAALEAHLKKRLDELCLDLKEKINNLNAKKKEREQVGVVLYSEQQDLAQHQAKLDDIHEQLQLHTASRLVREGEMANIRRLYKKMAKENDTMKDQANQLQKELDNVNMRVFYLLHNRDDVRSDVKIMRRAAMKTRDDLIKQEQEKQRQDYRLDTIVGMIDHKQQEIGMYEMQTLAQNDETKRLRNFLAEADLELEILGADLKQVESNWETTLLGMTRSDEAYSELVKQFSTEERQLLCKDKEIDALKKSLLHSEETHEKLTYIFNRSTNDIQTSKRAISKVQKRLDELKIEYSKKTRMLTAIESSLSQATMEKNSKIAEKLSVRRQFEHAVQARNETRDKLFDILQSQSGYSKAAEYAKKKIKEIRQRISKLNTDMSLEECDLAKIEQELISSETRNASNEVFAEQLRKDINERHSQITNYEQSFRQHHMVIERKQNYMDECNKTLASLLEKRDGNEVSPLENMVLNLTKSVRKESTNMLEDQTMWVEKQYEHLSLIQEKRDTDQKIKRRNQDILILTGRKRKLDAAIKQQLEEKKNLTVEIRHLRIEMEKLALLVHEKKGLKEDLETSGYLAETEFIRELKQKESEVHQLQDKLEGIKEEKENLLNNIVYLERQISMWERKIQLGVEMKEAVDPKNNQNADLHVMKCEIHRMTVRHQTLMREQEKLIRSMEDSVTRREYIVSSHKAAIKRDPDILTKSKCRRRIQNAKEKIAKFKKESVDMDKERKVLQKDVNELGVKLEARKAEVTRLKDESDILDKSIEEASLQKQRNLYELISRQKRAVSYNDVKEKKYKYIGKDRKHVAEDIRKEREKMRKIIEIIVQLKAKFPDVTVALEQVLCTYGHMFTSG